MRMRENAEFGEWPLTMEWILRTVRQFFLTNFSRWPKTAPQFRFALR